MQERLLTRDGRLLLFSTLLNSIPVGYINVVPLVYLAEIGYNPSVIGIIFSASAIANTIGLIPFGLLVDKYGRKKLLIVGTLLPCVSYAIFGLSLDPTWLTIASIIGGVGFAGGLAAAIVNPSIIPMLASSTSDTKRTTLFGILQGSWTLALTIGSALSFLPSLFSSSFNQSAKAAHFESYFIMSGLAVVSVIPILFLKERKSGIDRQTSTGIEQAFPQLTQKRIFSGRIGFTITSWSKIAMFSIVLALTGFGLGVLVQLLPTWYTLRYAVSESTVGLWMAVANLATIVAIPIIPRIVKRRGTVFTAAATGVFGACMLAVMPFTAIFNAAATLFAIRSVAYGISWAVLQSYMMGVVSDSERATTIGFAYTAMGLGTSLGTLIGGELLGAGLLTLPFVAGVICYVVSSVALPLFFRKVKPPEETSLFNLPRISE
ncbi:MAG: MFS transporter [Candidatus Bathyarchaeia archaeon]|jgi:MFS family permease